jgi:hypothetical protein
LDPSVLDEVAAALPDSSGAVTPAAEFAGSRVTFDSDSESDDGGGDGRGAAGADTSSEGYKGAAGKVYERRVAGGMTARASGSKPVKRSGGRHIPKAVLDFRNAHFFGDRLKRADGVSSRRTGKGKPARVFVTGKR